MARISRKPVIISPQARKDIESVLDHLKENWNQKVIDNFLDKLEAFYHIVSVNPRIFSYYSKSRNIRNAVFDTRRSPAKLKQTINKR